MNNNWDFLPNAINNNFGEDMESFTIEDYEAEQKRDMMELSNPRPVLSCWFNKVDCCVEVTSAVNGFVVKAEGWAGDDYVTRYFVANNNKELSDILEQHQALRND